MIAFIEDEDVIKKILKHLGLWDIKRKPSPVANAPPIIPDSYPIPSVDDYVIDPDRSTLRLSTGYPIDLSGEVRRTKTETYL